MLKLCRVASVDRHRRAVHMQLTDNRDLAGSARELWAERKLGALAEAQEPNEDVLRGVLVREESLPAAVCGVVAADELDRVRAHGVVDLFDSDLAGADVAAREPKLSHARHCELAEVSILDSRGDERHRDVALDTVDTCPRRHKGHEPRNDVNKLVGRIVLVEPFAPEFVEPCASDHQRGIDLEPVGTQRRRLKELAEAVEVALAGAVREVRHDVRDDFEPCVLGESERAAHVRHGVSPVCVARHVLVNGLDADL
eukprot:Amastigsp_a339562_118.p2 type:complete len:255 gc:universal Amastigsp_a339562_118:1515-751(-)